jgi:hypothetical protein
MVRKQMPRIDESDLHAQRLATKKFGKNIIAGNMAGKSRIKKL